MNKPKVLRIKNVLPNVLTVNLKRNVNVYGDWLEQGISSLQAGNLQCPVVKIHLRVTQKSGFVAPRSAADNLC